MAHRLIAAVVVVWLGFSPATERAWAAPPPPRDPAVAREAARLHQQAHALNAQGQVREAVPLYERILQVDPQFVPALKELAWIRATSRERDLRRPEEAVKLAESAFEILIVSFNDRPSHDAFPPNYDQIEILQVGAALAAAYAAVGRFQAPLDPTYAEQARRGRISAMAARAQSDSSDLAGDTVATWASEMAHAVHARKPFPQTKKLVEDLDKLLTLVRARRAIEDGRPLPGTEVR